MLNPITENSTEIKEECSGPSSDLSLMKSKGLSYSPGVPILQGLMPDDLRQNWCNNNRNEVHNECNKLESFPNHLFLPLVCGNICPPQKWSLVPKRLETTAIVYLFLKSQQRFSQLLLFTPNFNIPFLLVLNILHSTSEENSEKNTVNACFGVKRNCVSLFIFLHSSHFFTLQVQPENTGQLPWQFAFSKIYISRNLKKILNHIHYREHSTISVLFNF